MPLSACSPLIFLMECCWSAFEGRERELNSETVQSKKSLKTKSATLNKSLSWNMSRTNVQWKSFAKPFLLKLFYSAKCNNLCKNGFTYLIQLFRQKSILLMLHEWCPLLRKQVDCLPSEIVLSAKLTVLEKKQSCGFKTIMWTSVIIIVWCLCCW